MKTLESFKIANKPTKRVSKLLTYKNEIMNLYFEHYTIEQILDFLKINKVKISKAALYNFINKNKNKNIVPTTPVQVKTKKEMINKPTEIKKEDIVMNHFFKEIDTVVTDNK
jgi:hypothetical protein